MSTKPESSAILEKNEKENSEPPQSFREYFSHPLLREGKMERRRYQEIIAASCINKNSLVVLPTGLGKTPIAILVAAHRLYKYPESKVLVMAPTKPLVEQHYRTFREFLKLPPEAFVVVTGKVKRDKRAELWSKGRVFFATPQVVENDIITGLLSFKDFSLVVFDEAHRAVGDYAYTYIARKYMEEAKNPLILGLTASPGGSVEKIGMICGNLFVENVEIRTELDPDVKPYVARKEIKWVTVRIPEAFVKVSRLLERALRKRLASLRDAGFREVSASPRKISKKVLLELQQRVLKALEKGEGSGALFGAAQALAMAIKLLHAIELLQTQGARQCYEFFRELEMDENKRKSDEMLLADEDVKAAISLLSRLISSGVEHPKFKHILSILEREVKDDRKAIVFAQYVRTAELVVEYIKKHGSPLLKPVLFVGQRKGMTQKKQLEIMEAFRKGLFNVLVASSVAEEGLDIPKVDTVIFYEPIPSEIRSIQRRGRTGRFGEGRIYILMTKGTMDEAFYWSAYHKEKRMMKYLRKLREELKKANIVVHTSPFFSKQGVVNSIKLADSPWNVKPENMSMENGDAGSEEEKTTVGGHRAGSLTKEEKRDEGGKESKENEGRTGEEKMEDGGGEKNNKSLEEKRNREEEVKDTEEKKSFVPVQMSLDNFIRKNGNGSRKVEFAPRDDDNSVFSENCTGKERSEEQSAWETSVSGRVVIYADAREKKLIKILMEMGADVRVKQIDVGDFQISASVGIERKTARDFVNSIVDGRLFNQLRNLAEAFERPILVIEGRDFYHRNVHPNAIRGAIASAILDFNMPVVFTENERETALFLITLAKREQEEKNGTIAIRVKKRPKRLEELQEFVVAGLPGVNTKLAKKLLQHFGSVRKVFSASEQELQKVEGIGRKKAREITKLLDARYGDGEE